MWCMCAFCGFVPVNNVRPFTYVRWIEQNNSASHNRKVENHEHTKKIKAAKSSKGGTVSEKELLEVKIITRTQVSISNFLTSKMKTENQSIGTSHASGFNILHTYGSDTTKKLQGKSKNESRKKPRIGKTSTSDKEFKVQSCKGIISFQSTEHKNN